MRKYIFKKKLNTIIVSIIDFFGNFFLKVKKKKIDITNIKKILVVRLDHLGDIVTSIPVYGQLKKNFPHWQVSVLTSSEGREIFLNNPFIDKVITFSCPWFNRNYKKWHLKDFFYLRKILLNENFDCALELRGDIRNIFLLKLCGIKNIIGYGITGGGFLLTVELLWKKSLHAVDKNLAVLEGLRLKYSSELPKIYWDEDEKELKDAYRLLEISNDKNLIVTYHLDSGVETRRWPLEKFLDLIEKVSNSFKVKTVIIGKREIAGLQKLDALSLIGKTTLRQLIHVIRLSSLLVTNESGPAHIAAAVGTPVVIIWGGSTDPRIWAPKGKNVEIIHKDVDCQFCEKEKCSSMKCLKMISVEDVFLVIKKLLSNMVKDENRYRCENDR
ncbi:MAG: glycosyltransferase family 9 protein [Elusimicrobiota bacterium]|nr:glycosyltransferase family 9 protein [Endomicrobiia bacterium]MDW8166338.1 glycosyltransferase family 9 protein [Elusimicrobiota bacterium]